jgi:inorganic triphosphatase YgiF
MSPDPQEIEAKLAAPDERVFAELLALDALGQFALRPLEQPERQVNVYFDTADGRLRDARHGLRVRSIGERRILTLKGPARLTGDVQARSEWEQELGGDTPDALPDGELRARVQALTGGRSLEPVAVVHTLRQHIQATPSAAQAPAVEIALDEGLITAGGRSMPLREVELELLAGGDRADLDRLVALVRERFGLEREPRSKQQRALELRDIPPPFPAYVQAVALNLYDGLPGTPFEAPARELLQYAAGAYGAARAAACADPERSAHDAILAGGAAGLGADQRSIAAAIALLQSDRARPSREPALLRLRRPQRRLARQLASILRVAAAITVSPITRLAIGPDEAGTRITLAGPGCAIALPLILRAAGSWADQIGPVALACGDAQATRAIVLPPVAPGAPDAAPQITGSSPAVALAQQQLRQQLERMLKYARGVRRGRDPEDTHQMRVATRRLRAALTLMEQLAGGRSAARLRDGVRNLSDTLAQVRDLDVLLESLSAYRASLADAGQAPIEPLVAAATQAHARAHARLVATLAGQPYRRLRRRLARLATRATPERAALIRDCAGSLLWRGYEELRALGPAERLLDADREHGAHQHQARIAGKRLRYNLELLAEALGPRVQELLTPLGELQDVLGALQDSVAAAQQIDRLGLAHDPGAQAFLAQRQAGRAALLQQLPAVWQRVDGPVFRNLLLELIGQL